jgi:hypothetical protein
MVGGGLIFAMKIKSFTPFPASPCEQGEEHSREGVRFTCL